MKVWKFIRSMRFGILLLVLIALLSVLGSVIPQGRSLDWYAQSYPRTQALLLALQLDDVFTSWYFAALLALLCLNLALCSVSRIAAVVRSGKSFVSAAAALPDSRSLTPEERQKLEQHLIAAGCRREDFGAARVYVKNRAGRYGSFVTHLAILLTVLFGAAALYLPVVVDRDCYPGEAVKLEDGTAVEVASFTTEDETGALEFESTLRVTLPDGRQSGWERIRVNHPLRFGPYKIYQQTYGTVAAVTATNRETGGSDVFFLSDPSFISLDNRSGLLFMALYPDYTYNTEGEIMLLPAAVDGAGHPVYCVQLMGAESAELRFFFPGDTAEAGGLSFRFEEPQLYPGLRIKYTPALVNALLIVCFVLMIAGLCLLFFLPPVLVKVDDEGYAVGGPKPEGMRLELERLLKS